RQDLGSGLPWAGMAENPNTDGVKGGRTLGSISIQTNTVCKKDSFYFGYFYDGTAFSSPFMQMEYPVLNINSDKYRLRLDSVQETSCDGTAKIPPYKFSYFSETVPRKL